MLAIEITSWCELEMGSISNACGHVSDFGVVMCGFDNNIVSGFAACK